MSNNMPLHYQTFNHGGFKVHSHIYYEFTFLSSLETVYTPHSVLTFLFILISGLYYKSFTTVIYNHIDSGQNYKTMITIVSYAPHLTLALSSVVNYDHK